MKNINLKDFDAEALKKHLTDHVNLLKKEIEDNNGKIPKHRIEEQRKLGVL